ncbi:MAG: hypothetical protein IKW64_01000 [Clostridia bacterium]|nr:hypothetical protein [Clostridia bacterium]
MKNSVKKLIIAVLAVCMTVPAFSGIVFADAATNVALNAAVSSATHPQGGKDGNSIKPLSYLVDGSTSNYLRTAVYGGATGDYLVYEPNTSADIHLCVDLGSTYAIEKLVFQPRSGNALATKRAFTVYGSNDSLAATADWASAYGLTSLYTAESLSQTTALEIPLTDKSYRYIVVTMAGKAEYGAMTIGDLEVWADASTATTVSVPKNMALASNNANVNVSSVTHPNGGKDGVVKPLSNLNDGKSSNYFCLTYLTSGGDEYAPVGTGKTIHACLDLGDIYDISKIVISPRSDIASPESWLMQGFTVYGSNDPAVKGENWENADLYTIKKITEADGLTSTGNYSYLKIADDYEIDLSQLQAKNKKFRYIVLAQPFENNKYQYYYMKFGEMAVFADPEAVDGALVTTSSKYPSPGAGFNASISDSIGYTGMFTDMDSVTLIAAQYRNNVLEDVKYIDVAEASLSSSKLELTMPRDTANVKYRYYIWNDMEDCVPVMMNEVYTYGLKNVASGKTVDSVAFDEKADGTWSIFGNTNTNYCQTAHFGLCDGSAYMVTENGVKTATVFYANNAGYNTTMLDAYVDLGAQYNIECIKILPRGDMQANNIQGMAIYGFNDIAWINNIASGSAITQELLDANATLIHEFGSSETLTQLTTGTSITDANSKVIDAQGQSFRYILCVRPSNGYKAWGFGEMEVYAKNN